MTFAISADITGIDALFDDLGDNLDDAIRPAAQAAAQVLYDEVMRNVSRIGSVTGNLGSSIYQAYSADNSGASRATYHVSWNAKKAPHGHLVENGFIQRYASYVGSDGNWYTAVKPSMRDKPKPKRRANQSEKDAYYVARPGGPVQWLGKAFIRKAQSKFNEAAKAAEDELWRRLTYIRLWEDK